MKHATNPGLTASRRYLRLTNTSRENPKIALRHVATPPPHRLLVRFQLNGGIPHRTAHTGPDGRTRKRRWRPLARNLKEITRLFDPPSSFHLSLHQHFADMIRLLRSKPQAARSLVSRNDPTNTRSRWKGTRAETDRRTMCCLPRYGMGVLVTARSAVDPSYSSRRLFVSLFPAVQ